MRAGGEILEALDQASRGVQAASTELSELTQRFYEASYGPEGEITMGIALQFKSAVDDEKVSIYEDAIDHDRKPPAEDIREAKASRAVRTKDPELWANYHATKARIDALRSWISNQKSTISANQSIRKAEIP